MSIKENVNKICQSIYDIALKRGRNPENIKLVAVTKTRSPYEIQEAVNAGVTNLGENRVMEASAKMPLIIGDVKWHLIGHLQSNKTKEAVKSFEWIESLDSLKIADLISDRAVAENKKINVLVQVKISTEESKFGAPPEDVKKIVLYASSKKNLIVKGLMAIGTFGVPIEQTRREFANMCELFMKLKDCPDTSPFMQDLSMGMSNDYLIAVEEGSTIVRIGTAIFGKRQ